MSIWLINMLMFEYITQMNVKNDLQLESVEICIIGLLVIYAIEHNMSYITIV